MKWLKESTVLHLVSILIASILWVLVLSGRNFQIAKSLTLRVVPPQTMVISNTPPYSVTVHFRGPKVILKGLEKRLDYMTVDLSKYEAGEHHIAFHEEMLGDLPVGVRVMAIEPAAIRVQLDPLQERVVKVEPVILGDPAPGYQVDHVDIQPEKVVIRGANARLASLTSVKTEAVRVDSLRETTSFQRQVVYEFRSGLLREERPPVTVTVHMRETPHPRLFADIPIVIKGDWKGTDLAPAAVEVKLEGPRALMANVDASLIHAFVNVTPETKRAKAGYVPVQIELDEKIRNQVRVAEVTPPRVRVYQR